MRTSIASCSIWLGSTTSAAPGSARSSVQAKRLAKVQGALALCALQPAVHDLFILSGLDGILTIVKTQSDAIAVLI